MKFINNKKSLTIGLLICFVLSISTIVFTLIQLIKKSNELKDFNWLLSIAKEDDNANPSVELKEYITNKKKQITAVTTEIAYHSVSLATTIILITGLAIITIHRIKTLRQNPLIAEQEKANSETAKAKRQEKKKQKLEEKLNKLNK